MDLNKYIIVNSIIQNINRSKLNGVLDSRGIRIFNIIKKYVDITTNDFDLTVENNTLQRLLPLIKYKFPDTICNIKGELPKTYLSATETVNIAPTVINANVDILFEEIYIFSASQFTDTYTDLNGHSPVKIQFDPSLLTQGHLEYLNSPVTTLLEVDITKIPEVNYYRDIQTTITNDQLLFRISDGNVFSNKGTMSINGNDIVVPNLPATIGDITVIVDNRAITTLTLAMFTSQLTPPYNDPENDLIDAIRFDEISTANRGVFKLSGVPIIENQIVTRQSIEANNLTHESADQNDIWGDNFSFSARDEGSQIWVS